jgi:hypothetical protein
LTADPQPSVDQHLLLEDYARTVQVFAVLSDIRFKLLAFVPAVVGATVALVSKQTDQRLIFAVSILGLVATLGILIYELRNSEVYNGASHRARILERELQLVPSVPRRRRTWVDQGEERASVWPEQAGVFSERIYVPKHGEPGFRLFGVLTVKHDRALALVYGVAVGGWLYLLVDASLRLAGLGRHGAFAAALLIAAAGAAGVVSEVRRHDNSAQMRPWERQPGAEVASTD